MWHASWADVGSDLPEFADFARQRFTNNLALPTVRQATATLDSQPVNLGDDPGCRLTDRCDDLRRDRRNLRFGEALGRDAPHPPMSDRYSENDGLAL